jgi:GH24 family phage-related lysozyme (muramidase)
MSKKGLHLLECQESKGCKPELNVYKDSRGLDTTGYGHLWHKGDPTHIKKEQAEAQLSSDLSKATEFVANGLKTTTSQSMIDALIDTAYTSERGAGILINQVNAGQNPGIIDFINTLPRGFYDQPGLLNRRTDEFLESRGTYIQVYPF